MPNDAPLRIISADRVRDGLLLAFSDGVVVLYPSHFLISLRDHHENRRLPEDNED